MKNSNTYNILRYLLTINFLLVLTFSLSDLHAQTSARTDRPADLSLEFQAYPTGLIPGIRFEKAFQSQYAFHIRGGINWVRHRDLGVHEDERGTGLGFTLGVKRYFSEGFESWFAGIKSDLWFNSIDWKDGIDSPSEIMGHTDIVVLQPTAELGYCFRTGDYFFVPALAIGVEINIKTDGEDVGEGAILLFGIQIGRRF